MTDVMTVSGPVPYDELGVVLPHEHVFINLVSEFRTTGLLRDFDLATAELSRFRDAGGGTIVDCTTGEIGRDPVGLRKMGQELGLNIICGTGHYRDPYLDRDWFDRMSVDEIAQQMITELTVGIGDTGIRAGIIGEIGCDREYISAAEERSFRAAARAHLATGATITTHAARWPVGPLQLDILEHEGVDPRRVIVGLCDQVPDPGYDREIGARGAWIQFDTLAHYWFVPHDIDRVIRRTLDLIDAGFGDRLLISHDVCLRSNYTVAGGCGYDYRDTVFAEALANAGATQEDLHTLFVANPARALAGGTE